MSMDTTLMELHGMLTSSTPVCVTPHGVSAWAPERHNWRNILDLIVLRVSAPTTPHLLAHSPSPLGSGRCPSGDNPHTGETETDCEGERQYTYGTSSPPSPCLYCVVRRLWGGGQSLSC
jgi:hypothetical protein